MADEDGLSQHRKYLKDISHHVGNKETTTANHNSGSAMCVVVLNRGVLDVGSNVCDIDVMILYL